MREVKTIERGWAGHFICALNCRFRRNTLVTDGKTRIIVSSVGLMEHKIGSGDFEQIGCDRYYETMAFHSDSADTRYYDVYGHPDRERALIEIGYERKLLEKDSRALSSVIRKEPITPEEAFRVDGDSCIYDALLSQSYRDTLDHPYSIEENKRIFYLSLYTLGDQYLSSSSSDRNSEDRLYK